MTTDPIDEIFALFKADFRKALTAAYGRGVADGQTAMRDQVVQSLRPIMPIVGVTPVTPKAKRARKGEAKALVQAYLMDGIPRTITEIENLVQQNNHDIALKSIGNALRAGDGKDFKRDGKRWTLMGVA